MNVKVSWALLWFLERRYRLRPFSPINRLDCSSGRRHRHGAALTTHFDNNMDHMTHVQRIKASHVHHDVKKNGQSDPVYPQNINKSTSSSNETKSFSTHSTRNNFNGAMISDSSATAFTTPPDVRVQDSARVTSIVSVLVQIAHGSELATVLHV